MDLSREHDIIDSVEDLAGNIIRCHTEAKKIEKIAESHPMAVTPHYLNLIEPDNPDDPIKKMAVPSLAEMSLEGSFDTSLRETVSPSSW